MVAPTASVSPSWATILSVPAWSASYVMLALSVSISTSSSPRSTESPSDLSHFRIVPSSMESDRRGIATSAMPGRVYGTRSRPRSGGRAVGQRRTPTYRGGSRATSNQNRLMAWTSAVKSSRSSGFTT